MKSLHPSPARASPRPLRSPHTKPKGLSLFKSPARTSAAASTTPAPSPSSPTPRQSLVYGPLATTSVATVVREASRTQPREGTPEKMIAPISPVHRAESRTRSGSSCPLQSSSRASSALHHTTPTRDELRELRQIRSLFLCGRGLLSLRHIQHLSDMLSLRFLSVHMNAIKSLEAGCLKTLRHLVELDLSANELQDLPVGCWAGLDGLERLNLSSNLLTALGPNAFKGLSSLQWLSLGFNNLSNIIGLSSVPVTAPLSYVDLCSNRIAAVEEVMQALTPHREHLREVRLASPSPLTGATPLTSSYWRVQENPLCSSDGDENAALALNAVDAAAPSPPAYAQRLFLFFPHLVIVNGVSYGVDPLEALRPQLRSSPAAAVVSEVQGQQIGAGEGQEDEKQEKVLGTSDAFAQLLSQPLPRIPSTSSSSPFSLRSTSQGTQRHGSHRALRRHHHSHRHSKSSHSRSRSRSRSEKHSRSEHSSKKLQYDMESKTETKSENTQMVTDGMDNNEEKIHKQHATGAIPTKAVFSSSATALVIPPKRRHSAPKPRRATLRRRTTSAVTSPPSNTSSTTASPSIVPPVDKAMPSDVAVTSSPHARQLSYDDEGQHLNSSTSIPGELSKADTLEKRRLSNGSGAAAARSIKRSATGLSPSGITDASDLSPSLERATTQRRAGASTEKSVDAFLVNMSGSDCTEVGGRSPDILATDAARQFHLVGEPTTRSLSTAVSNGATAARRTSQMAVRSPSMKCLSFPTVSSTSLTGFPWKPKQISRGTSTEPAGMPTEAEKEALTAAAVEQVQSEMHVRVEQLQEQLALRTTTIAALRRHLDLTRSQYMELQKEAQQEQQQLRRQVAALKDELARRSEEASIVQRKQHAQLNRAVDSVKTEWARRLEASEQLSAAVQAEAKAKWEEELSRLHEDKVQLQQTATVKTAQLATLERQVRVMEDDMGRLRQNSMLLQQHIVLQANLCVAEAEERRQVEAAAAKVFLDCFVTFSECRSQLERDALQETLVQLHEVVEVLDMQQVAHRTQTQEYAAALQHAAGELRQLRAAEKNSSDGSGDVARAEIEQQQQSGKKTATSSNDDAVPPSLEQEERAADAVLDSVLVSTPTPTPTHTPQLPSCAALVVSSVRPPALSGLNIIRPHPSSDPNDTISSYWRDVCTRTEAQLQRVEAALLVATATQQTLASENTRLLRRVESLEEDQVTAREERKALEQMATQEKENMLRTLHTLRADMEKKDGALDTLEEEARAKLSEKRQRIAELEEQVDTLTAQQTRTTEMNVSYRTQLEAVQRSLAEVQDELDKERNRYNTAMQQQASQLPGMEGKLRELSELLATRVAQAHQHELEKKTLVHALTTAREQLVRLQESNTFLAGANAGAKEQLVRQQMELDAARQQLRDMQEATRAKQRATREALSHLMTADTF